MEIYFKLIDNLFIETKKIIFLYINQLVLLRNKIINRRKNENIQKLFKKKELIDRIYGKNIFNILILILVPSLNNREIKKLIIYIINEKTKRKINYLLKYLVDVNIDVGELKLINYI